MILAVVGLLIIYSDTVRPRPLHCAWPTTRWSRTLLTASSFTPRPAAASISRNRCLQRLVWADLAWYTVLIALTDGVNSFFFFFYLFAIIVASSRVGYLSGLWSRQSLRPFAWSWLLWRLPGRLSMWRDSRCARSTIVGLGYILSYWGGAEIALRRRMALLNELSLFANPAVWSGLDDRTDTARLLGFWKRRIASFCWLTTTDLDLYLVSSDDPQRCQKVPVKSQADVPFIDMADASSLVYNDRPRRWARRKSYPELRPADECRRCHDHLLRARHWRSFSSARSFVSVPLHYRERFRGRIVVSSVAVARIRYQRRRVSAAGCQPGSSVHRKHPAC